MLACRLVVTFDPSPRTVAAVAGRLSLRLYPARAAHSRPRNPVREAPEGDPEHVIGKTRVEQVVSGGSVGYDGSGNDVAKTRIGWKRNRVFFSRNGRVAQR